MTERFQLVSPFKPSGDQPDAIARLTAGFEAGLAQQTLLGVTGSGKTFTIANMVERIQRPTLVMAPNKTLAAQLYGEFREFFPHNAVEYFVSYYDYYQPEAYVPSSDTYIEKDASINEHIEQMRLAATKALLSRPDALIVATVSAIYGLGDPEDYLQMRLILARGEHTDQRKLIRHLTELQYTRGDIELRRGSYRVRGEVIDVFPAESETEALRIELFDGEIENLSLFDPLTGATLRKVPRYVVYPKTHYATTRESVLNAIETIKAELKERLDYLYKANKLVEAQRLEQRTRFDLEMMAEVGYCNGIENYSRHLTRRQPGEPPPTLFDYLPPDALLVVDESHDQHHAPRRQPEAVRESAQRAGRRRFDRRRARQGRVGRQGRRATGRLESNDRPRRQARDRHREESRSARGDPSLDRASARPGGATPVPEGAGHDRPGHRQRLLLRFRV